jgi:hypothetical protein
MLIAPLAELMASKKSGRGLGCHPGSGESTALDFEAFLSSHAYQQVAPLIRTPGAVWMPSTGEVT